MWVFFLLLKGLLLVCSFLLVWLLEWAAYQSVLLGCQDVGQLIVCCHLTWASAVVSVTACGGGRSVGWLAGRMKWL